jgi:trigger factor
MEHTVEKLSGNKVKISFKATAEEFEEAVGKSYLKNRGRFNVPGFRRGKAPRKLMERMLGETIFYDDALETLFPEAYVETVEKEELHPVSRPEFDVEKIEQGQEVHFSCEVYVQPEVKLGEYKGVEIARKVHKVTKADVDARLEEERKHVARSMDITDRPLKDGDEATLDYAGTVDGVAFNGGTAKDQKLLIGSGSFIPGFEEQMVGMNVGEEKDLTVTFPADYHAEDLKGKEAVFHVKLSAVAHEELPELDDEFASEVSDFDTLVEFTADIEDKLKKTADETATENAKQSLIQKVVDAAEVEIPDPMIEEKLDDLMSDMDWRMKQQGFDMKKYMQLTGQTEEQIRAMYRGEAQNSLKTELVVDEIIKAENVQADEKEIDDLLEEYAKGTGKTAEELKADLPATPRLHQQGAGHAVGHRQGNRRGRNRRRDGSVRRAEEEGQGKEDCRVRDGTRRGR